MHDVYTVGIPLLAIFAGVLFNGWNERQTRKEVKDARSEFNSKIDSLRSEANGQLAAITADLRAFYHETGVHEGRLSALERQRH